jgi:hypothetical protein
MSWAIEINPFMDVMAPNNTISADMWREGERCFPIPHRLKGLTVGAYNKAVR